MGLFRTSLFVVLSFAVMSVQAANWTSRSYSNGEDLKGFGSFKKKPYNGAKKWGVNTVKKDDGHPVKSGQTSIRFEVRDGDCGSSGSGWSDCREKNGGNERHEIGHQRLETGPWRYHWSLYFPQDVNFPENIDVFLGQWHEDLPGTSSGGDPLFYFFVKNGVFQLQKRHQCGKYRNIVVDQVVNMVERWSDLEIYVNWTAKPDGFFQVNYNSQPFFRYNGPTLRPESTNGVNFNMGIYRTQVGRGNQPLGPTIVYFDDVIREKATSKSEKNKNSKAHSMITLEQKCEAPKLLDFSVSTSEICKQAAIEWRTARGEWAKAAESRGLSAESCKLFLK